MEMMSGAHVAKASRKHETLQERSHEDIDEQSLPEGSGRWPPGSQLGACFKASLWQQQTICSRM